MGSEETAGEKVILSKGEYKGVEKLLKASKASKILDGVKSCSDVVFLQKSKAMQYLMGHLDHKDPAVAAAVGEAVFNFCAYPEQPADSPFPLFLINKKSNSWKGLTPIVSLVNDLGNELSGSLG